MNKSSKPAPAMQSGFKAGRRFLDLLSPPMCIQCRELVTGARGLCASCWSAIRFIDGPCCSCGLPFDVPTIGETRCAPCHAHPPSFDVARAVTGYDEASRGVLLALKHADRLDAVPGFARWLVRTGRELIAGADWIVPVPLPRKRL